MQQILTIENISISDGLLVIYKEGIYNQGKTRESQFVSQFLQEFTGFQLTNEK